MENNDYIEFEGVRRYQPDALHKRMLARIVELEAALLVANKALSETIRRCGTGYNWNADPDKITFLCGEAFAKMSKIQPAA